MEAEGPPGDETDLGVGGLDEGVGQAVDERRLNGLPVGPDRTGHLHERGQAAARRPGQPGVQQGQGLAGG